MFFKMLTLSTVVCNDEDRERSGSGEAAGKWGEHNQLFIKREMRSRHPKTGAHGQELENYYDQPPCELFESGKTMKQKKIQTA